MYQGTKGSKTMFDTPHLDTSTHTYVYIWNIKNNENEIDLANFPVSES